MKKFGFKCLLCAVIAGSCASPGAASASNDDVPALSDDVLTMLAEVQIPRRQEFLALQKRFGRLFATYEKLRFYFLKEFDRYSQKRGGLQKVLAAAPMPVFDEQNESNNRAFDERRQNEEKDPDFLLLTASQHYTSAFHGYKDWRKETGEGRSLRNFAVEIEFLKADVSTLKNAIKALQTNMDLLRMRRAQYASEAEPVEAGEAGEDTSDHQQLNSTLFIEAMKKKLADEKGQSFDGNDLMAAIAKHLAEQAADKAGFIELLDKAIAGGFDETILQACEVTDAEEANWVSEQFVIHLIRAGVELCEWLDDEDFLVLLEKAALLGKPTVLKQLSLSIPNYDRNPHISLLAKSMILAESESDRVAMNLYNVYRMLPANEGGDQAPRHLPKLNSIAVVIAAFLANDHHFPYTQHGVRVLEQHLTDEIKKAAAGSLSPFTPEKLARACLKWAKAIRDSGVPPTLRT